MDKVFCYYTNCIGGERACPPEDVSRIHDYEILLEATKNLDDPERDTYAEWIGDDFDPEAFDMDAINAALRALR